MFSLSYLANDDVQKQKPYFDPTASLLEDLKKEKKKLSRLYDFDDDENDDVLEDKITKTRLRIAELNALLLDAEKQSEIERKILKAKSLFKNLESTWEHMSPEERQAICRELIERVEIFKNGEINVHLKLNNYLINNNI